ncbi:BZIP transcription factor [Quillaja saponaria]|uniref:BZIP transcription factor n=1 Tax=Quillaja saponaria TaxID=32244 RepID=A0AAD7PYI5_QUISA|nr:BZIP transcription factor [Quillaja saponaria]KAJ7971523.1 BZIP transcription factor [Quillaja saponaria]
MEAEKRCASSSSSSSSSTAWEGTLGGAVDRMVQTEIEAAETLADLAQLAMRGSGSDSGEKWWAKMKRSRKRAISESEARESGLNTVDSVSRCPDLAEGQAVVNHQLCENIGLKPRNIEHGPCGKQVKVDLDSELPITSSVSTRSYTLVGCGKSRHNLTEEEKEAKRIRRVLANRESARQTIRRRQALCEELTKKAADLALENENLKKTKDLALKEYQSLEAKNKHLKEQVGKAIRTKVEKTPAQSKPAEAEIHTSSTNCPFLLYNRPPITPFCWPSIAQSSNPVQLQHGPQSSIVIPSKVSLSEPCGPDSCYGQNNLINNNGTLNPLYILPYPWFFPHFGNGQLTSVGVKTNLDGHPVNKQNSASSSSNTDAHTDNYEATLPINLKSEASCSTEARPLNDLNETSLRFSLDGGERKLKSHIEEMFHRPASLRCVGHALAVEHEDGILSNGTPSSEVPSAASYIVCALSEKKQEENKCQSKKLVDAVAAAGARKRRKELTKLKNFHGRQCRLHC